MSNRSQLILIVAVCGGALAFLGVQVFRSSDARGYAPDTNFTERAKLAEFTENGVHVGLFMDADAKGQPLLRATFTPTDDGFHVYGKDLDPKATEGIGVPTRLELMPHSSVKASGPLLANVTTKRHSGLEIYPDGPVSLRLPIQFVEADTNLTVQVAIRYMACKTDGVCLIPVDPHILDVQLAAQ